MSNRGFLIGRMGASRPSIARAVTALFNPRVSSATACDTFLALLRKRQRPMVRIPVVHTAVFAPPGAGKSTGLVIPHLLTCPDACVVVDVKGGELFKATARARIAMRHRIVALDPFRVVTRMPDCFNPLEHIDGASPEALDDCRDLAEALVVRTGQEREPHWLDSAEVWIGAMAAATVQYAEEGDKSLQAVRELLTNPKKTEAVIQLMCQSDAWDGMLARLGHQLTHFKDKELGSTLTTTNRFLRFLDTLAIAESTSASSFDPAELLSGRMTVYLILPPEHLRAQAALLRMWLGSLLRAVVRGGLSDRPVHFVIDEAAALGHMESLGDALAQYRGYGVRLQLYYQSVAQLKKCWPQDQDQTVLSNCTQVYFAVNDNQTAEYVSNRLGEFTQVVTSGGSSGGTSKSAGGQGTTSYSYSDNWSENWQQAGRKLLKPEEVMALSERAAITFTQGIPPICTTLVRHYEHDFGRKPRRSFAALRALFDALVLLVAAGLLALALTQMASEGHLPGGGGQPSGSADPFTADYWQMR